jgi:ABC-2 type transport system ATP-binding protein
MQRRLELACALLHDPHLLFVDEPTAGLDPVLREKVWEHLRTLREQGRTILVTTQYIDEARYCDTVAVMVKGRLAASGTPDELRQQAMGGEAVDLTVEGLTRADVGELWQMELVSRVDRTGNDTLRVMVEDAATATPAITQALQERGRTVVSASPYVPTFDEVFMKVVGEQEDGSRRDA